MPSSAASDSPAPAPRVITIGVYEFDLPSFLAALRASHVGLLVDVRQRRGVRGARYAWANSRRLQQALAEEGIAYSHHHELTPTAELRHLQYAADDRHGVGKRSRAQLDPAYVDGYVREVLDRADLDALIAELPPERDDRAAVRRGRPRGLPPLADRRATGPALPRSRRPCAAGRAGSGQCAPVTSSRRRPSGSSRYAA